MSSQFSKAKKSIVGNKFNWHCAYCGGKLNQETLVIDHITAKSQGGSNHIDNLFLSCRACNCSKGTKTLEQYRLYLAFHKAVNDIDFNQAQIEFLYQKGLLAALGVKYHQFFFEGIFR